jgi:hypothetical protein
MLKRPSQSISLQNKQEFCIYRKQSQVFYNSFSPGDVFKKHGSQITADERDIVVFQPPSCQPI